MEIFEDFEDIEDVKYLLDLICYLCPLIISERNIKRKMRKLYPKSFDRYNFPQLIVFFSCGGIEVDPYLFLPIEIAIKYLMCFYIKMRSPSNGSDWKTTKMVKLKQKFITMSYKSCVYWLQKDNRRLLLKTLENHHELDQKLSE